RRTDVRAPDQESAAGLAARALLEDQVMARLRLDLRPILRAIAARIQDENQGRLLQGRGVRDEELAPKKEGPSEAATTRKRVRLLGVRVKLRELSGKLGVKTGELLKDLVRRGNIKL